VNAIIYNRYKKESFGFPAQILHDISVYKVRLAKEKRNIQYEKQLGKQKR